MKSYTAIALLIAPLITTAILARPIGQVVPITFLEKLIELKTQSNSMVEQGKTVKANNLWSGATSLVKRQFKHGTWYALPEGCYAKKGSVWPLEVECFNGLLVGESQPDGIQFALEIPYGNFRDKLLEAIQDTEGDYLDVSFRVGSDSPASFVAKATGFAHTGVAGLTVYITGLEIHRRHKEIQASPQPTE